MPEIISKEEFLDKISKDIDFSQEEKRRKLLLFQMVLSYIVTLLFLCLCICSVVYFFFSEKSFSFWLILGFMAAGVFIYGYLENISDNFYNKFKKDLKNYRNDNVNDLLGIKKFCSFEYDYSSEIKKSNLFTDFTNAEFDDILGNKDFMAMETKLIHTEEFEGKHGKEEYNTTIYRGLILFFKSNKHIKAKTIITSKNDNGINNYISLKGVLKGLFCFLFPCFIIIAYIIYLGWIDLKSPDIFLLCLLQAPLFCLIVWGIIKLAPVIKTYQKNKNYFKNLKLEDISFDKRFNVYSEDQVEGRYLVTPAFMDRLYNLQTAFGVSNIKCSFFEDKIMFAISTKKDLFELGTLYKSFGKDIEDFYNEISSIYDMIDYFKLNERTGL